MAGQKIIDGLNEALGSVKDIELDACKFCKHDGEGIQYARDNRTEKWQVSCLACGATGPEKASMYFAAVAWNTRSLPFTEGDLVAALREAFAAGKNGFNCPTMLIESELTTSLQIHFPAISRIRKAIGE